MKKILLGAMLIAASNLFAQDSAKTAAPAPNPFSFNGFVEAYYQYDFNKPTDNNRPGFIYSHNRHNEFNLNIGFLKGSYNAERVRANIAIAAGATGGKISGAGGGGFMIFYCPANTRYQVISALQKCNGNLREYSFTKLGLQTWTVE